MPYLVKLEGPQPWQGTKLFTSPAPSLTWEPDAYRVEAMKYVAHCSGFLP